MAETIKSPLSENEMNFCEYWEKDVLPRKYKITTGMLDRASSLLGYRRTGNCSQCMRNDAIELNNRFQRLYQNYKQQKSFEESAKLVEETKKVEVKEEPVKEEPKKKPIKRSRKRTTKAKEYLNKKRKNDE